jgi:hypothetical protein
MLQCGYSLDFVAKGHIISLLVQYATGVKHDHSATGRTDHSGYIRYYFAGNHDRYLAVRGTTQEGPHGTIENPGVYPDR